MKMLINGKETDSVSGKTAEVLSPATGEVIDTVPVADEKDIDLSLSAAETAFRSWKETPLHERASIMMKFVELVRENRDSLARTLSMDDGKPITQAEKEIDNIFISVPAFTERAKHIHNEMVPAGNEKNYEKSLQFVTREPVGIIVCIIPFNFPSNLFCQKVIPSLLMGNTCLVLPPSGNPLTVMNLSRLLTEAGVPAGVINCVTAPGAVKEAAVRDRRISLVTLTGSTETGIKTARAAAENLVPTALELGGNDAFIVMDDADMDIVIRELFVGRLINAGQICCASKRFLIHNSRIKEFTDRTIEYVKTLKMGDPLDRDTTLGCLINEKAAMEVEEQVKKTVAAGAKILTGGNRKGAFFEATVLADVTRDMDIMKDMEVFGPVIPIIGFDTEEEAIDIANNTVYGLSGCVFSENYRKILRIASAMESGNVVINGASNLRSFEIPFGGWKMSGIGTEGVMSTFDEVTRVKVITIK